MHSKDWKPLVKRLLVLCFIFVSSLSALLTFPMVVSAESTDSWMKKIVQASEELGGTAIKAGEIAIDTTATVSAALGNEALQMGKVATRAAVPVGSTLGETASKIGRVAIRKAAQTGSALGDEALQVRKVATGVVTQVESTLGGTAAHVSQLAAKETFELMGQAATGTKYATELIAQSVVESFNTQVLPLLDVVIGGLDTAQIEATTHQWQHEHLNQTHAQLAGHYIWNHSRKALLPTDWMGTVRMQAEMIYEIASLHGLSLDDPTRKAEIISLATVSLGSSPAIKAGVGLLEYPLTQAPFAGDFVGVSSDSLLRFAMVNLLGHAACRYYETHSILSSSETLKVDLQK